MADGGSELGKNHYSVLDLTRHRNEDQSQLEARMPGKSGSRSISVVTNTALRRKTPDGICSRQYRFVSQAFLVLLCFLKVFTSHSPAQANDRPFPPHRIVGNVYYVGSQDLSSYLITTTNGHILINSSYEETVPLIKASVEKLKFRFQDVKILLTSHAHSDHVAGNALVKRLTGARVLVMEGDEDIVRTGGRGDFQYDSVWKPCPVDKV